MKDRISVSDKEQNAIEVMGCLETREHHQKNVRDGTKELM